jgi:hypothetical protein
MRDAGTRRAAGAMDFLVGVLGDVLRTAPASAVHAQEEEAGHWSYSGLPPATSAEPVYSLLGNHGDGFAVDCRGSA